MKKTIVLALFALFAAYTVSCGINSFSTAVQKKYADKLAEVMPK